MDSSTEAAHPTNGHASTAHIDADEELDSDVRELAELYSEMATAIARHPEEVRLRVVQGEGDSVILELDGHPKDIGIFIGRNGKNISAMRTIMIAAARKRRVHVMVEILQPERDEREDAR